MRPGVAWSLIVLLSACDTGSCPTCIVIDASGASDVSTVGCPAAPACDVLHQLGCAAGQKCAWVSTGAGFCGQIACATSGTESLAATCAYNGSDNCEAGLACHQGTCKQICDWRAGAEPSCPVQQPCLAVEGLFGTRALESPAGVCLPQ